MFCPECGKALSTAPNQSKQAQSDQSHSAKESDVAAPGENSEASESEKPEIEEQPPPSEAGQPSIDQNIDASVKEPKVDSPVTDTGNQSLQPSPAADEKQKPQAPADSPPAVNAVAVEAPHRRGEKARERLHRASEVARGVIEQPAKRVEKIRQVSSVVIEEASYDPSLRFVLVALGLFVLFIILLVLSKVMG